MFIDALGDGERAGRRTGAGDRGGTRNQTPEVVQTEDQVGTAAACADRVSQQLSVIITMRILSLVLESGASHVEASAGIKGALSLLQAMPISYQSATLEAERDSLDAAARGLTSS